MTMKRRDALKTIGGLAGAAGIARFLPGCGDNQVRETVGITNYVYLMMENRSYDHYFGARSMLEGLPGDGLTAAMFNPDSSGAHIAPFANLVDRGAAAADECDPDPPHGWDAAHASFNNGANDGFVIQHQMAHGNTSLVEPMKYQTRDTMPVTWALADAYTSCDRWFCSVMGPTLPNRAHWHTGTSFGIDTNNEILEKFSSVPVPTIYNRLDEKSVDWPTITARSPSSRCSPSRGRTSSTSAPTTAPGGSGASAMRRAAPASSSSTPPPARCRR